MDNMHQETDLNRIFEAAEQAHQKGAWEEALRLYKIVADQNPHYPGLYIRMRALETQVIRGLVPSHQRQRSELHGQPRKAPSTRPSHSASSRYVNPYFLYGIIAFLPAIILTLILNLVLFPDWDWVFSWLVIHNVVTFFVYLYDKAISPSSIVRVPERILLLQVLLGAFIGAPFARFIFRHKTQKLSFRLYFWMVEIISIAWVALYYIFIW